LSGVSERNLCARLATYLETNARNSGLKGYYADVEYNRNQGRVKTILDDRQQVVVINCDIILHSRGKNVRCDNLIAVEMKKAGGPEEEKQSDRDRLRALTKSSFDEIWSADGKTFPEHVCGYKLGYFIELDAANNGFIVEEYRGGKLSRSSAGKF
jgi:hypothetical protein